MKVVVRKRHPLIDDYQHPLYYPTGTVPIEARNMIRYWGNPPADGITIAKDGNSIVGFFRYCRRGRFIWAAGTWIDKNYRSKGLAKKLWERTIKAYKVNRIWVQVTTHGGKKLVHKMRKEFPKIKFLVRIYWRIR